MSTGEWEAEDLVDMKRIGIRAMRTTGPRCLANHKGLCCTRAEGHGGRHVASGMEYVIAVWRQQ